MVVERRSTSPPAVAGFSRARVVDEKARVLGLDVEASMGRILDGIADPDPLAGPVKAARSMKLAAATGVRDRGLMVLMSG